MIQSKYPQSHDWILKSEDSGQGKDSFHHFWNSLEKIDGVLTNDVIKRRFTGH